MATKVVCDRCDLECDELGWRLVLWEEKLGAPQRPTRLTRDLCAACVDALKDFLDEDEE